MVELIARVRQLTSAGTAAYTVDGSAAFTDDHLQDVLDRHVRTFHHVPLAWDQSWPGGGSVEWTEGHLPYGQLETGTAAFTLEDSLGANVGTASYTLDDQSGRITFTADQGGTVYYASGRSYNLWLACAEVLETWAAAESRSFDFQSDASRFARSQKAAGLLKAAAAFRRKAPAGRARLVRRDG